MTRNHDTNRRQFLRVGAAAALSMGVAGCSALPGGGGGATGGNDLRSIAYGETKEGRIDESDGVDPAYGDVAEPVQFQGTAGDTVVIEMDAPRLSAYLVLAGPGGSMVAEHQRGQGSHSEIRTTLPETGTYTIWAGTTYGEGRGNYTLTLRRITSSARSSGDGGDGGSSGGGDGPDLRAIAYGETKEGYIDANDGVDPEYGDVAEPVQFEGEAGDSVEIVMQAPGLSAYLVLAGPGGSMVAEHQRGQGSHSEIRTTLPETGTYTIWAGTTYGEGRGEYTLTLKRTGTSA